MLGKHRRRLLLVLFFVGQLEPNCTGARTSCKRPSPMSSCTARIGGEGAPARLWSPESPHLYSLRIVLRRQGTGDGEGKGEGEGEGANPKP